MATINTTNAQTFVSGDEVTPTKLNALGLPTVTVSDIVNADISASAAIAHTKLANITAASVLMGNASNAPTATAITGDVTVTSAGVTAIGSGKVVSTMLSGAQSGSAPVFGVRAWVTFNGKNNTGNTLAIDATNRFIKGSGNVSSVLRNGTGDYTITFTAALPSANYVVSGSIPGFAATNPTRVIVLKGTDAGASNKTTTSVTIVVGSSSSSGGTLVDSEEVGVMVIG
jgi:hypothetical protein